MSKAKWTAPAYRRSLQCI